MGIQDDPISVRKKWELVAEFCEIRKISKMGTHLQLLAQGADWVHLLWEAQSQSFDPDKLLQIVVSSVNPLDLRDHLDFVLRKMASTKRRLSNGNSLYILIIYASNM